MGRVLSGSLSIGVDVGGTKILAAVVDADGTIVERSVVHSPGHEGSSKQVEDAIYQAVTELTASHQVDAVGIGAAGFVDAAGERVVFAPNLPWRDEPLAASLSERLDLRVVVDNDANVALWGEATFGAARRRKHAVMITLGTGLGGAVLAHGRPYRGFGGMAAEFGHLQLTQDGPQCTCGRRGCWEQYCSGPALARYAREAGSDLEGHELLDAAVADDEAARSAFDEAGRWLGIGLANIVALFDPEIIVIGGGVSDAGELLFAPARKALEGDLVAAKYRTVPAIVRADLGPDAGVVGAAVLPRLEK